MSVARRLAKLEQAASEATVVAKIERDAARSGVSVEAVWAQHWLMRRRLRQLAEQSSVDGAVDVEGVLRQFCAEVGGDPEPHIACARNDGYDSSAAVLLGLDVSYGVIAKHVGASRQG